MQSSMEVYEDEEENVENNQRGSEFQSTSIREIYQSNRSMTQQQEMLVEKEIKMWLKE